MTRGRDAAIGDALVTRGGGLLLIVEKQPEGNTLEITHAIDAALAELAPALPGVEADATIFRPAGFIERALANLGGAMGIGFGKIVFGGLGQNVFNFEYADDPARPDRVTGGVPRETWSAFLQAKVGF